MSLTMNETERQAFLADLHVGIISIARAGRGPLTVPIWYDYTPGGTVTVITEQSSLKGKALADVERISLCAQSESLPYRYVSVEGPYEIKPLEDGELEAMAIRYLGEEQGRAYAAQGGGAGNVVVHLTPEHWLSVDYGKS